MNILIEQSGYGHVNHGDRAMLSAAYARLLDQFPGAAFDVLTRNPQLLAVDCPGANPISVVREGADAPRHTGLDARARDWIRRQREAVFGVTFPPDVEAALVRADLMVASGGGYLNETFAVHAGKTFDMMHKLARRNTPYFIVGNAFDPFESPRLREKAARALPRATLIACREGVTSPGVLRAMGVAAHRIVVTGDDALDMAYRARPAALGDYIGVNLRVSSYANVDADTVETLRPSLHEVASACGADLIPVPIAIHGDPTPIRALIGSGDGGTSLKTPTAVIAQVSRCRIVMTGSYHAAVFALAQGIPVVGIASSSYYGYKFEGLAAAFPGGVFIVRADTLTVSDDLRRALMRAWDTAPVVRDGLLSAAQSQIAASRTAYARIKI